ncbi:MAG: glycosyltransferase family 2 protein [Hyphomicrobiales bacterium]
MGTHFPPEPTIEGRTDQVTSAGSFLAESSAIVTPIGEQIPYTLNADQFSPRPYVRELEDDIAFLVGHGFDFNMLWAIQQTAKQHAVEAHHELIASGHLNAEVYYRLLAHHLGLPFLRSINPALVEIDLSDRHIISKLRENPRLLLRPTTGTTKLVLAPQQHEARDLLSRLTHAPELKERFFIASPSTIKDALLDHLKTPLEQHASSTMRKFMPQFSAFKVNKSIMLWVCTAALIGLLALVFSGQHIVVVSAGLILSLLFFVAICIRLLAALDLRHNKAQIPIPTRTPDQQLPVYSVLVALYKEANIVPDLVAALNDIDWPRTKLDIKLVIEEDDLATKHALEQATAGNCIFSIVVVPAGTTKTKPRALNYALAIARGEFVVIYDAEDRPDPQQLRAAYHRFLHADISTACIQAPLVIDNANRRWLSTMFEIEYASLFDGLLPALSSWRAPVMLGGTSNHFRCNVLRAVGGWDPHNVTEDADLGIRLKRFGHNVEMIDVPTFEEAPENYGVWLKQRTRWFKGWMQTSIVHLRNPKRTLNELGFARFLSLQLYSSLLLISALGHLFFLAYLGGQLALGILGGPHYVFFLLTANLIFAYLVHMFLAYRALAYRGKQKLFIYSLTLPLYWPLLSIAAWRALFQLYSAPHFWEKTPHGTVKRQAPPWQKQKLGKVSGQSAR